MTAGAVLPVQLQRVNGSGEVRFARRHGASRLVHLYQTDPCRILFPDGAGGEPPLAVLLTTSGGLTGGDRIRLHVAVDDGAALSVTSQAAEKIYRSIGPEHVVDVDVRIDVGSGAWLDWVPNPAILFDGARLQRRTTVSVSPGGRLLACEGFVFGRIARGESFATGSLLERWRVAMAGRLRWVDALRLTDEGAGTRNGPFLLAGAQAMATAVYVADDAGQFLAPARELLAEAGRAAGATVVNDVLIARFLGDAQEVQHRLRAYLSGLRPLVGPFSGAVPSLT